MTHFDSDHELDALLQSADDRILRGIKNALDATIGLAAITGTTPLPAAASTARSEWGAAGPATTTERRHAKGTEDSAAESRTRAPAETIEEDYTDDPHAASTVTPDNVHVTDEPLVTDASYETESTDNVHVTEEEA
ncbi:hypothetical protein [Streptomyces hokutonensis]|uniref:hypothetical protein n=1 Tax=Streptomyces hokutonensis TaxID=1306990 RepID=UPI0037F15FD8